MDANNTLDAPAAPTIPPGPKPRGPIVRATAAQTKTLLDAFNASSSTTPAILEGLSKETGLSSKWIAAWFSRQRNKKRKAELSSMSEATQGISGASSADTTLEVKKEVCEGMMKAPMSEAAGQTKRQAAKAATTRPAKSVKRRKVVVVVAENPSAAPAAASSGSGSVFDKITVKMERYTPEPSGLVSSSSNTDSANTSTGSTDTDTSIDGMALAFSNQRKKVITGAATSLEQMFGANSAGVVSYFRPASISSAAAVGASLPLKVKNNRRRGQLVGEGPIMRTQFQNRVPENFSSGSIAAPLPLPTAVASADKRVPLYHMSPALVSVRPDYVPGYRATVEHGYNPSVSSTYQSSFVPRGDGLADVFPKKPVQGPQGAVCTESDWMVGFTRHLEETAELQTNIYYSTSASSEEQRTLNNAENFHLSGWTPPAGVDDLGTSFSYLDPLHAPLKYLTDILDPVCGQLGGYEKLVELEGDEKQAVLQTLLNEDMDPFKAAMGLVVASGMGLRWD